MSSLRHRTIHLASSDPELRPLLLPVLDKTAGNLGEELNPFMLDTDNLNWEVINDALLGEIEMVAGRVGSMVMSATRNGLNRSKGAASEDTKELYTGELKARLISIIERVLPD